MSVNIPRDCIDLLLQLREDGFVFVDIAILVQKQQNQKLDEFLMNNQIAEIANNTRKNIR